MFYFMTSHCVLFFLPSVDTTRALLDHHKDKILVLKVFAPWCKACKGLEPKFNALVRDEKYERLPMVWADLTIQNNKDFVKSIGVLALPTIQFYARGQKLDTFPCGPSKVPILKRKLVQLVNDQVDAKTFQLKDIADVTMQEGASAMASATEVTATSDGTNTAVIVPDTTADGTAVADATGVAETTMASAAAAEPAATDKEEVTVEKIIQRNKSMLRGTKYLSELLESEFETLLTKAALLTFESGSIIMREGNIGRTFYIILDGEVEICQRTSFEDPLTTPPSYLGTVINRMDERGDYFGERSLITGEPRAASIRAGTRTTCLAFDQDDFPKTSVLSGRASLIDDVSKATVLNEVNDKYGIALIDVNQLVDKKQYEDSVKGSQVRGSVNTPRPIDGVDNDLEIEEYDEAMIVEAPEALAAGESYESSLGVETATIVPLLMRFKLIRSITRCFDYIVKNRLKFGDAGTRRRRTMLVNLLSPMQRREIADAFRLVDEDGNGEINLMELRRIMDSIGQERSDQELLDLIEKSHFMMDSKRVITQEDFTGLMAEAEIYSLFLDTFKSLDQDDTGFVRAKDLDRVLCGVRDLISDDRNSIIDVEDMEMMVDYEQFSRMLLGTALCFKEGSC
jgi:Ca2+-binding EF-hand superfamily protein/thiol-disulfide isomerase/thioredoxin